MALLGLRDAFDPRAVLQLIPVGVGEVRIQVTNKLTLQIAAAI